MFYLSMYLPAVVCWRFAAIWRSGEQGLVITSVMCCGDLGTPPIHLQQEEKAPRHMPGKEGGPRTREDDKTQTTGL